MITTLAVLLEAVIPAIDIMHNAATIVIAVAAADVQAARAVDVVAVAEVIGNKESSIVNAWNAIQMVLLKKLIPFRLLSQRTDQGN